MLCIKRSLCRRVVAGWVMFVYCVETAKYTAFAMECEQQTVPKLLNGTVVPIQMTLNDP